MYFEYFKNYFKACVQQLYHNTLLSIKKFNDFQVVLGGGQEAMEVTTTTTRAGKFDARFYHMIFEEEIGRVKGHFGPINSLAFHPDGKR